MKPPPVQPLSQLPAAPANTRNAWQHARWTARGRKIRPWQKKWKDFCPQMSVGAHIYIRKALLRCCYRNGGPIAGRLPERAVAGRRARIIK